MCHHDEAQVLLGLSSLDSVVFSGFLLHTRVIEWVSEWSRAEQSWTECVCCGLRLAALASTDTVECRRARPYDTYSCYMLSRNKAALLPSYAPMSRWKASAGESSCPVHSSLFLRPSNVRLLRQELQEDAFIHIQCWKIILAPSYFIAFTFCNASFNKNSY